MGELELIFDDDKQQMENQFQMMRRVQRDLLFHNTVPLPEEQLPEAREKARVQKNIVLVLFSQYPDKNFTPPEIFEMIKDAGGCAILTSIRRSISDLTKEGRLIKCDYSESRKGAYGALNRVWRYNSDYIKPINPQK